MIEITGSLSLPEDELVATFSTSGGPGGQNVNRVRTRVTLTFNVVNSPSLTDAERRSIIERLGTRIDRQGNLRVRCQRHRTQGQNRAEACERLTRLLADALQEKPERRRTRKPRAAAERRLEEKRHRSRIKASRGPADSWD